MRAFFGIAGILITVGVIVWFMAKGGLDKTQQDLATGRKLETQVKQIAGQDTGTGERVDKSADLEPLRTGGKLNGILVTRVSPDGAYGKYFGIKRNDTIVAVIYQANRMDVKDMDEEMAMTQVYEAYTRSGQVVVVRDEKQLTLPETAQAKPAAPAGAKKQSDDPLQRQLDVIQGIPGAQ